MLMIKTKPTQIVAMACMPGCIERGLQVRTGVDYARYGKATWRWWCKQRGIEFVVLDQSLGGEAFEQMPPTIQRWLAPAILLDRYGKHSRIALIDADTMIRWDAPNFLDLGGTELAAGHAARPRWVERTIGAYQRFFPDVHLAPSGYFNSGVVLVGERQLSTLARFTEFARLHWPELKAVQKSGNFGSDQTLLNFIVSREQESLYFLPSVFNMLHCGYHSSLLLTQGTNTPLPSEAFLRTLKMSPQVFRFINSSYVWHFTAFYEERFSLMRETWHRIRRQYRGADCLE